MVGEWLGASERVAIHQALAGGFAARHSRARLVEGRSDEELELLTVALAAAVKDGTCGEFDLDAMDLCEWLAEYRAELVREA